VKPKVLVSWSGGKDSALVLGALLRAGSFEVAELLTTFVAAERAGDGEEDGRISGHDVPLRLLRRQAEALGLPLRAVGVPPQATNAIYESRVGEALRSARARGIGHAAFGDLFLEDIRAYRERLISEVGITPLFPLWGRETGALARAFLAEGYGARIVAVDRMRLSPDLAGRPYDQAFLDGLPPGVDPCGENGEFHTFVHAGPVFSRPLEVHAGRRSTQGGYEYCEPIE
jgi:uncharacterized protein (TIGR00290 family)